MKAILSIFNDETRDNYHLLDSESILEDIPFRFNVGDVINKNLIFAFGGLEFNAELSSDTALIVKECEFLVDENNIIYQLCICHVEYH
jgi:hypothetical protein